MCDIHTKSEMPRINCKLVWVYFGYLFIFPPKYGCFTHSNGDNTLCELAAIIPFVLGPVCFRSCSKTGLLRLFEHVRLPRSRRTR